MINRASAKDLRQSIELAENLKKTGLAFIPIPYVSQEQKEGLIKQQFEVLENIIKESEQD
jgi:hypothetical protein|nr:DUF1382 family protein [uncultured Neisseria sp.]